MRVTRNYMSALMGLNKNSKSRSHMMDRLQTNSQNRFLTTQQTSKASGTMSTYQSMKNNAGELQNTASKLTDTGEDSIFARAEESGSTAEVTKEIKNFVAQYNSMMRNLKNGGSRVDTSYRNQLDSYTMMHRDSLKTTGVTKQADGTLSIDEKALQSADLEHLKRAWGTRSSFAASAGNVAGNVQANAVSSVNSIVGNSYSNLLRGYGRSGNFFNFWS